MVTYLLDGLRFTPSILERLVAALPAHVLDRAQDGRFTPREVLAHLADWEPILRARVESAVNSSGSTIEAYDEAAMAEENGYSSSDLDESLRTFAMERGRTVSFFETLTPEQLQAHVIHPERGMLSAYDLAVVMLGHDVYHMEQLTALLDSPHDAGS
ncbi:MAG TPA: DinB family protein [Fimbriimonadaceae bacterium]|nr:DinB family protein [Fimbriimonadaceae bacterium]